MTPKKAACAFEMLFAGKKRQKPPRIVRNRADSFGKAMNGLRKAAFRVEWAFHPEKSQKESFVMNGKNNQLNVPQAREAMDKFKMQAASDLDVPVTY